MVVFYLVLNSLSLSVFSCMLLQAFSCPSINVQCWQFCSGCLSLLLV